MKKTCNILLLALAVLLQYEAKAQPAAFADPMYADIGKKGLDALSRGDVNAWLDGFADNARYYWSGGDSLIGKPAIKEYWTSRRKNDLTALNFSEQIFLPVDVKTPQANEPAGVWLLSWYRVNASYKASGKSMSQWVHSVMHFNSEGKIDQIIQYIDRVPINAAMR